MTILQQSSGGAQCPGVCALPNLLQSMPIVDNFYNLLSQTPILSQSKTIEAWLNLSGWQSCSNPAPIGQSSAQGTEGGGGEVRILEVKALPLCTYNPYNRATIKRQSCIKNYKKLIEKIKKHSLWDIQSFNPASIQPQSWLNHVTIPFQSWLNQDRLSTIRQSNTNPYNQTTILKKIKRSKRKENFIHSIKWQ